MSGAEENHPRFAGAVTFFRDWRIRVLVPLIAVNLAAFAGLYILMDRFAVNNVVNTQKHGASILLDELELDFVDLMLNHGGPTLLPSHMARQTEVHGLAAINVYDFSGRPVLSTRPSGASLDEVAQARVILLAPPGHPTLWLNEEKGRSALFGVRPLTNAAECHGCHGADQPRVGAVQMNLDLTQLLTATRARVRRTFAIAGVAWFAILALILWTVRVVIGRPIAAIEKSLSTETKDLDALALRVHDKLWEVIHAQRQREETMAKQMVRAEQLAALGELAAGLTHEIKNPLAGVIAALEVLASEGDVQNRELHDQMLAELRRVTTTLEGLLRLARPQPPQRIETDMRRVVREVTSLFAARTRRQGIAFEAEIDDSVPALPLDSGLIVQLMVNLLTNALQATERGGTIRVLLNSFPMHDGVIVAVSDTGSGIDPEKLARVFDPFFTTKEAGTGLGLAICRQIVEQHGGTITVESEVGKGTRVVVLLPDLRRIEEEEPDGAVAAG